MKTIKIILFFLIVLFQIISLSAATKAYMGVSFRELSQKKQQELNIDGYYGLVITKIEAESPAEKGNLQVGDILLKINQEKVYTKDQILKMMQTLQPGDKLKVSILRDKKEKDLTIKLGEVKDYSKKAYLGVFLSDLDSKDYEELSINYGVKVEKVMEDSPSEKAGIQNNDVLLKLNGEKLYSSDQISKMLHNYEPNQKVEMTIQREGKLKNVKVTLGEKEVHDFLGSYPELFDEDNVFFWKSDGKKQIGIKARDLTEQSLENFNLENGIQVVHVIENSAAEKAGIMANDVILTVDDIAIKSVEELIAEISKHDIGENVTLSIYRNNKKIKVTCEIEERKNIDFLDNLHFDFDDADIKVIYQKGKELFDSKDIQHKLQNKIKKIELIQEERLPELDRNLDELDEKIKEIKVEVELEEKSM